MTGSPFTNPFRYVPHPLVRKAARELVEKLDRMIAEGAVSAEVAKGFTDGKMLGVLVCQEGYLAAFSGSVGGQSTVDGFVPPIFDLTRHDGYYRKHEAEISCINEQIRDMTASELEPAREQLAGARKKMEEEIAVLRAMKHDTVAGSQFRNAEIKRAKDRWKTEILRLEAGLNEVQTRINTLKKDRSRKSDELQRWIFGQYMVCNAEGVEASILEIFNEKGLMPPGGTGDCAAPKLLNHAYRNGMTPMAMGEFWYGRSPSTAVRTHGHFYPSCTSKCGPLLNYMLRGTAVIGWGHMERTCPPRLGGACRTAGGGPWNVPHPMTAGNTPDPHIAKVVYEDADIVVVCKPSGMPSVPGLDGRESLQELLQKELQTPVIAVHRLDMDTSGLIVFAKNHQAESCLKKQFEEHTVKKTYLARLSPAGPHVAVRPLHAGDKCKIELPLSPDYDERPRQKVDITQGKAALTEYEVMTVNEDGTTDILFHPHTGRTHQLRVHSAHILGLGRPILGDLLYGGCGSIWAEDREYARLHLHACSITFRHPSTGESLTLTW
ncbi:MAG: RluA family pseudouridine synthase [Bacteroidales bacterium]|nr:RluA family pseudouridine synthase [Bacteroidales bacterium]